jgi:hypothetical protein
VEEPEGERDNFEDLGVDGEDIKWIHLVHDRDQWRSLVNTVKNLRVPGKFLSS